MAEKREFWDSRFAFVMAAVGSAVGLGNVWRFPYECYANGGGAFLIPFLVALFTAGIPLLILEFGLGHMTQKSAPLAFAEIRKKYQWIGWMAVLIGLVVMSYYGAVMGWCFNYLKFSFTEAWKGNEEAFFFKDFLQLSGGISEVGKPVYAILFGTFLCWMFVFLSIYKGVKSVGKVVMITVPLPLVILVILAIRGITLPGAAEGLAFYLTPDFAKLLDPEVWLSAYGQVFFSVTIGFGVMIAYASFLPEDSDITANAFIIGLADSGVSFLAGFAVFSTLGYLAFSQDKMVSEVVKAGPGLVFVTYPTTLSLLPFAVSLFAVIFFIMLLTLGIDSAFSLVEAGVAGGIDKWKIPRVVVNASVSFVMFLVGIIFTTKAGLYWLDIVDHYLTNYGLTMMGLLECVIIGYVFGTKKVRDHVNKTSDMKLGVWWDVCIKIITPAVLLTMFIMRALQEIKTPYEGYPNWAQAVGGWGLLILLAVIAIVLAVIPAAKKGKE